MAALDVPLLLILYASGAALLGLAILYANACLLVGRERWPEGVLLVIAVVGALLSLCSILPCLWLIPWTAGGLVLGAILQLWRSGVPRWRAVLPQDATAWIAASVLILQLLWAAAPFYRYDQWNYHLVIAKYVLAKASLPRVIYDDHLFFTGIYEYLLLIPRYFLANDLFLASFADAFTFCLFGALVYGGARRLQKRCLQVEPASIIGGLVLAAFIVVTAPYQHSITNAKPEALLAACALLCVANWPWLARSGGSWQWLGFFLVWPLGLKVTWLHAAAALGLPSLIMALRQRAIWQLTQGGLAGLVLILPWVLKNQLFFDNILHPLQIAMFRSSYWNDAMVRHWQSSSGAARSLADYLAILGINLPSVFIHDFWPLLAILSLLGLGCLKGRRARSRDVLLRSLGVTLTIYLLMTPLALDPRIQARFAIPVIGLILAALVWCLGHSVWSRRVHDWLLLGILLLAGGFDVTVSKLSQLIQTGSVRRYYERYGMPYTHLSIAETINAHRQITYPKASLEEHIVAQTEPLKYFYDSAHLRLGHYDDDMLRTDFNKSRSEPFCLPAYLHHLKVSYVVLDTTDPARIDGALTALISRYGERLPHSVPIWHIGEDVLQAASKQTDLCPSLPDR